MKQPMTPEEIKALVGELEITIKYMRITARGMGEDERLGQPYVQLVAGYTVMDQAAQMLREDGEELENTIKAATSACEKEKKAMSDEYAIRREKSPKTFGKNKYLVELFITQRHVVTVFADTPELAEKRACDSAMIENGTLRGFGLSGGVSGVHFDEDYGCEVKAGAPEEAEEEIDSSE